MFEEEYNFYVHEHGFYKASFRTFIQKFKQDSNIADWLWNDFILHKSDGFTMSSLQRINESIRTYVYAILGAQAQTKTRILGNSPFLDAQKQFKVIVEDRISSAVDIQASILHYQELL